ncbi:MAG: DUF1207 domain-containing protein [Thermoguttaceae bacterium]
MFVARVVITTIVAGGLLATGRPCLAQTVMQAVPTSTAVAPPSNSPAPYALDFGPGSPTFLPGNQGTGTGLSLPPTNPSWPGEQYWTWQVLPEGLIYRSYLASPKEPRLGVVLFHERDGSFWDASVGGRVGILRYGTSDPLWPEGFELDVEGGAFPRLTLDYDRDLVSVDFRAGIPLTYRHGPWETKFGYYHLSAHLGDEFLLKHPDVERLNYSRESLLLGVALRPHPDIRLYAETGWAFYTDGGAKPWEFQFGVEYSPAMPASCRGAPFVAVGTQLHQEVDFGGTLVVQTGWEWRSANGRLLRCGLHYLNGKSNQSQFFQEHEEQIGFGTWVDF